MKRFLLLIVFFSIIFSQEIVMKKIKIDRQTESLLSTLFAIKPHGIELFVTDDSLYIIEANYKDKKITKSLTNIEYQKLLTMKTEKIIILEDARVPFLLGQTILGIGVYSWGLPVALSLEDRAAAATGLLTPFVWTGATYLLTNRKNISGGAAYGSFMGGIEGAFHGGFLLNSGRAIMPFSIAENFIDFSLGQELDFTPGMFQRKFNHVIYGGYHYAGFVILLGKEHEFSVESNLRYGSVVSLAEGYTALFSSTRSNYLTYGDALFELRTSMFGAQFIPLCIASYDLFREEASDLKIYAGTSLIGFVGGYILGNKLSRENDLSGPAAFLTYLMPYLAHGLTGGLTLIIDEEGKSIARAYPLIFLATDLGLTYFAYDRFVEKHANARHIEKGGFNFYFNPIGFVTNDQFLSKLPFVAFSYSF